MSSTAVIVEDEPLARASLRQLIDEIVWLEAVGEAADGDSAVRLIDEHRPDVVFLDVELPEISGLKVLERIEHRPRIVFTTAYDRYAVDAFELEAIDYLVKPFGRRRFRETLQRLRRRMQQEAGATDYERVRSVLDGGLPPRLFARIGDRIVPVPVASILRLEAADDYVQARCEDDTHLLDHSLAELEELLDPERFCRVHRSHMINLDYVVEMRRYDARRLLISMADGSQVLASRGGSKKLRGRMP